MRAKLLHGTNLSVITNMELKPGQIWKHYKGNDYKIIIIGKHSETAEDMVVYEQLQLIALLLQILHIQGAAQ